MAISGYPVRITQLCQKEKLEVIEIKGDTHYVFKVMSVLMENTQKPYHKHVENLISFLIANKVKAQTLFKSLEIELGFDHYLKSLQEESLYPELEFIFCLLINDIRA